MPRTTWPSLFTRKVQGLVLVHLFDCYTPRFGTLSKQPFGFAFAKADCYCRGPMISLESLATLTSPSIRRGISQRQQGRHVVSRHGAVLLCGALVALLCVAPSMLYAGKIVLRVQAGNPIDVPQLVKIKSNLPAGVSTNHILNLGGLDLGYDIKHDVYYVHKDVELSGKEIVVFDVEIDDIWNVAPSELESIESHSKLLAIKLEREPTHESALSLRDRVAEDVGDIRTRQNDNAISSGRKAIDHIRAYESNLQVLKRVKMDVARLENLAMAAGIDPGALIGMDVRSASLSTRDSYKTETDRVAVIRIAVQNRSETSKRTIRLKRELPPEVRIDDVLDSGGLDVGMDSENKVAYVYKDRIELEPDQRLLFTVKIRDRWNINKPRIAGMLTEATNTMARIANKGNFEGLEESLSEIVSALTGIQQEAGPTTVSQRYVAYYRGQGQALDELEAKLNRILTAIPELKRSASLMSNVKPPSPKTTWMVIYIILAFLALFSLLFYLRWYKRGEKDEETL